MLYGVFAYLLYAVVLVLVFGYQNITPGQGAGLVGGPVGLYTIKKLINSYYGYRISSTETLLETLQEQQKETIERLKAATKYSTTLSLIEKYGGTVAKVVNEPAQAQQQGKALKPGPKHQPGRQPQPALPPPHIQQQLQQQQKIVQQQLMAQRREGYSPTPGHRIPSGANPQPQPLHMQAHTQSPSIHHLQPEEASTPRWYDRLMDLVLGEDETSAKARYALICKKCRMVNGLAPPGTTDPNDVEEWGCARCGMMNGTKKSRMDTLGMLAPPSAATSRAASPAVSLAAITDDGASFSGDSEEADEKKEDGEVEVPQPKSTSSRKSPRKTKAKA